MDASIFCHTLLLLLDPIRGWGRYGGKRGSPSGGGGGGRELPHKEPHLAFVFWTTTPPHLFSPLFFGLLLLFSLHGNLGGVSSSVFTVHWTLSTHSQRLEVFGVVVFQFVFGLCVAFSSFGAVPYDSSGWDWRSENWLAKEEEKLTRVSGCHADANLWTLADDSSVWVEREKRNNAFNGRIKRVRKKKMDRQSEKIDIDLVCSREMQPVRSRVSWMRTWLAHVANDGRRRLSKTWKGWHAGINNTTRNLRKRKEKLE